MSDYVPWTTDNGTDEKFTRFCALADEIADDLLNELGERVGVAMSMAGEDHTNMPLLRTRVRQVAYSLDSKARREWEQELTR